MSGKRRSLFDGLQVPNLEELADELGVELPTTEGDRLFREHVDRILKAARPFPNQQVLGLPFEGAKVGDVVTVYLQLARERSSDGAP